MIVLIVEDGTAKPDAESYATVAQFKAYAALMGFDIAGYLDATIEQALRRATLYLDANFAERLKGQRTTAEQALEWPRSGVSYRSVSLPSTTVPPKVINALCEAAWRELERPHRLTPDQSANAVKRRKVGDVETEFVVGANGNAPKFPAIDNYMIDFLEAPKTGFVGKATRG